MTPEPSFDLGAYLARIGLPAPAHSLAPTLATLRALHRAHATSIPFENLDIQLGRPVAIDLASIQAKLVTARRGGYCFEQNALFAAALRQLGFEVTTLAARVRYLAKAVLPKTHMTLAIDLPEGRFLADVGFGGYGLTAPIELVPDREQRAGADPYRLVREGDGIFALEAKLQGLWEPLYAFTLEEHVHADYEMANHYTSTFPGSRFVASLIVARIGETGERFHLRDRRATVRRGDAIVEERDLADEELLDVLRSRFALDFPSGTRFRALASPA